MKKFKNIFFIFLFAFFFIIISIYILFLYIIPTIANSQKTTVFIEERIKNKTGLDVKFENLEIKTFKNLSISFKANKISIEKEKNKILDAQNVDMRVNVLKKQLTNININYIYIDATELINFFPKSKKTKNSNVKINSLPKVNISQIEINLKNNNNPNYLINIKNAKSIYNEKHNEHTTAFTTTIYSNCLKNDILIENENSIRFDSKNIKLENLKIKIGKSFLCLNGWISPKQKRKSITITGKNIPIDDIQSSALYYLKFKNPKKNFMENFTDYSGNADINLEINNTGINGRVFVKKLGGKTVLFNIPIRFNNFTAYFREQRINAEAYGYLGYEKVYTNFSLSNYEKEKRKIQGSVYSSISNKTAEKYVPDLKIKGDIKTTVKYRIEHSTPKIVYIAKLDKYTNVEYKNAGTGLYDKKRHIIIRTKKQADKLYITDYEYSIQDSINIQKILTGDGLFEKINNEMRPSYITIKTDAPTPISITGSFGERLDGGTFNGNIKVDFIKHLLTGQFNLSDSKFKNFKINSADINANENTIVISSEGTYLNSPYKCYINMDNNFNENIKIHDINLFLDEYVIQKKEKSVNNIKNVKIPDKVKELEYTVENGSIKLNKLIHKRFLIEDITVHGNLLNNIVSFNTEQAHFAKGNLQANGQFDIKTKNAIIDFSADNIDSNAVATIMFNLPNEIKGIANASLHAKLNIDTFDILANAKFAIKEGYLPKIGSTEFILKGARKLKKPIKIRLSDIINIDISKAKAMASDINGCFIVDNWNLKDIKLFSKQKYLSLFVEGEYDIEKEDASLKLWGKYNKTARNKVKILFIPLSFIMNIVFKEESTIDTYSSKIKQIPTIKATEEETEFFRVSIDGNLNKDKAKIELKSIK